MDAGAALLAGGSAEMAEGTCATAVNELRAKMNGSKNFMRGII